MVIELRRIFESDDIKQEFAYEFDAEDELFSTPIAVKGYVKNATGIVSISAEADFSVSTQCAKCAKDIRNKLNVAVDHFLIDELHDEDNDDYIVVEDMKLNLDELVLEDIYLSLPTRFLCKNDCKGLCPYCGIDLNEGSCDCKKPIDPRMAALQALLSDDE